MSIKNQDFLRNLVREVVVELVNKPKTPMFKEEGNEEEKKEETPAPDPKPEPKPEMEIETPKDREQQMFEEDPINYILKKYPSLTSTLTMFMSKDFKDYLTGIYIIAPKPTTFKMVLHNGESFTLAFLGKAYEAKVSGKKYYLLTIGERERAIIAIARLLENGSPLQVKGPESEETSKAGEPEGFETETPAETEKEETTES
jgi:hypothetical protein